MRPHRLRLVAFGPFAETVEIDFDALADGGLFLLHGDTGSGKTSILDGLAFALYGRVPGHRATAARLRSDHAAPNVRTMVEVEVTVAGRRLLIRRWPEQERPKQRGVGTTRDQAQIRLQEADGAGWRPISERVGEADKELIELLGMSVEQFHQVVVLPQGEFARFLRSEAAERTRLLQRLFGTDRFRAVEDWLAARRRDTAGAYETARAGLLRLGARVAQAAAVDELAPADDEVPDRAWALGHAEAAVDAATAADDELERRLGSLQTAERELGAALDLARRQTRRRELLERRDALAAVQPAMVEAQRRLDAGRRAESLRLELTQLRRRRRLVETVAAELAASRAALPADVGCPDDLASLRAETDRRRLQLGRLDVAEGLEDELRAVRDRGLCASRAAAEATALLDRTRSRLAELPVRREQQQLRQSEAEQARDRLPKLEAELDRLTRAADAAVALGAAREDRRARSAALLTQRELWNDRREEATRLRNERIDSMIAELSAGLVDGDPCPVCGASEHPDPSEVRGSRVTREQEEAAQAAVDQAQRVLLDQQQRLAATDAEIGALEARIAEVADSDDAALLGEAVATVRAERELAQHRFSCLAEIVAVGRVLADDERALRERILIGEQSRAQLAERVEEAETRAAELHGQLQLLLDGASDVASARSRDGRRLAALETALDVADRTATAARELADAEQTAVAAVCAAGFAGIADADAALLAPAQLDGLQSELDRARSARVAVDNELDDPDVAVELEPPAPVGACEIMRETARVAARSAASVSTQARARAAALEELAPQFAAAVDDLVPLQERALETRRLADLVAGQGANRLRMTLSAYVLAARLEEVAAVASERLRRMTQGRYTLSHTDAARGGGRAGLGLLARDAWTGQDRATATLSGGETFLASLALALALGDVVTAESGGAGVEALFVDEGFGSLDEETLDEVMDTLDGLREGGRMVGLVSHVGELRVRIPSQVHVKKGRTGSSVEVRAG